MALEQDTEKLVKLQAKLISHFFGFGMEIPKPGDWLFEAAEKNRQEKLFLTTPFYLPRRQLAEGASFPGLRYPLDSWLYSQIRAGTVAQDADWLSGEWVLFDITRTPDYDDGKQMYPDFPRFKELLATLREKDQIAVTDYYKDTPKGSRFAISADEVDGSSAVVAKAVAAILGLKSEQVSTPSYSTFIYIGNLANLKLGQASTWEWFRNTFEYVNRLFGGVSYVNCIWSAERGGGVGFRLQISAPTAS